MRVPCCQLRARARRCALRLFRQGPSEERLAKDQHCMAPSPDPRTGGCAAPRPKKGLATPTPTPLCTLWCLWARQRCRRPRTEASWPLPLLRSVLFCCTALLRPSAARSAAKNGAPSAPRPMIFDRAKGPPLSARPSRRPACPHSSARRPSSRLACVRGALTHGRGREAAPIRPPAIPSLCLVGFPLCRRTRWMGSCMHAPHSVAAGGGGTQPQPLPPHGPRALRRAPRPVEDAPPPAGAAFLCGGEL
jgi:hypothetical protein